MFRTLGLLDSVVCPALRDGECRRLACPMSHDLSKVPRPAKSPPADAPPKRRKVAAEDAPVAVRRIAVH
jgi:hypothetical protein